MLVEKYLRVEKLFYRPACRIANTIYMDALGIQISGGITISDANIDFITWNTTGDLLTIPKSKYALVMPSNIFYCIHSQTNLYSVQFSIIPRNGRGVVIVNTNFGTISIELSGDGTRLTAPSGYGPFIVGYVPA